MYGPVEIRYSCIIIHNYNPGDNERLERMFSIYDPLYHQVYIKILRYDAEKKDLYIPAGVALFNIIDSFDSSRLIEKGSPDPYDDIGTVRIKYKPRDEEQAKAIRFCLGLGEFTNNRGASQISLNLNTGKGKTYIAIYVFSVYRMRTMMITSSIDWLVQWENKILEYTDLKKDEIYIISGANSIAKLKIGLKDPKKIRFYLCSHSTLEAYAKKNGWEAIRELFQFLRIGIKIFDEAHLFFDNICNIDYSTNCWKTYYLTATPMKSDRKEDYIYQNSFRTIPKIDLFNENTDPHTAYTAILFNSHPSPVDINHCQNPYGFSRLGYIEYFVQRPAYTKMLIIIMDKILRETSPMGKVLIYIGTNNAILITYRWMKYFYPNIPIGIFTSIVPKERKQLELNNKVILTTTKSAGAALDIQGLEKTIVFNEPFNSKVIARQTLGRTRSDNTEYIELVDVGFNTLIRYYRNKVRNVYMKYATSCNEIKMNDRYIDDAITSIWSQRTVNIKQQMTENKNLKQVAYIEKRD